MSVENEIEQALETGDLGGLDPMTDAPNSKESDGSFVPPSVDEPETPEDITPDVTPTSDKVEPTPEDIASRLEGENVTTDEDEGDAPKASEPMPFDFTRLSQEQMQTLKRMLNATPDRPTRKAQGISIKLRVIDGKVLRDFGKAYNGYITDPEDTMRKIVVPKIKVWLFGEAEPREMLYSDFMETKRQIFKVLSTRQDVEEVEEGETIHAESGQLVQMIATYITRYFTVQLPSGEKVEIKDKIANA